MVVLLPLLLLMLVVSGCAAPVAAIDAAPTLIIRDDPLPVIAVAPALGKPGMTVFVSGAGWQPDSAVFINLMTETEEDESLEVTVAASNVAADGRFSASFVYPYDPPWNLLDLVTIVAYSTDTGDEATAIFGVASDQDTTGTPTITPTPVVTSTPTPTPGHASDADMASSTATVISTGLNVRSGPSTAYPVIRQLKRGDTMLVLGQSADSYWLYVQLRDGLIGWVARNYTDFRGAVAVVRPGGPPPVMATPTPQSMASRWLGEYFNNVNLSGQSALVRNDYSLNFNWGYGSPDQRIQPNYFSARWTQPVYFPGGAFRFFAETDDGVRVYVDDVLVIDSWQAATGRVLTGEVPIARGTHVVRVEYFELTQIAKVKVWWARIDGITFPEWRGEYYANKDLAGSPRLVRNDAAIDFNWGDGSPASYIPNDSFSARWSRTVYLDSDRYRFSARMDDGMRVYLDGSLIIDSWRDGSARTLSTERDVSAGNHLIVVEYYEHLQQAEAKFWWEKAGGSSPDSYPDWKGKYWSNRHLSGDSTVTRNDRSIDFNWGTGSPDSRIPNDNFSARWTREYDFDDGWYRIKARSDDGVRVWVEDDRIIDEWHDSIGDVTYSHDIYLGENTDLKVEYYERYGGASVEVWWERIDGPHTATPTPTKTLTPTPAATRSPYARLSPDGGLPGVSVSVTGGGFPANATVNIHLASPVRSRDASDARVYASTTADGNGNYGASVTIPTEWPGGGDIEPGELLVIAATSDYSVSASVVFQVKEARPTVSADPYAELQPGSGGPNTSVTIRGGGFPASTSINVYLGGVVSAASRTSSPTVYASGSSDGNGNYAISFTMPDTWADGSEVSTGTINVMAATSGFGVSAGALFDYFRDEPNPSISLSPSSGGAGTVVIVNGEGYPGQKGVNIYLGAFDGSIGSGDPFLYGTTRTISSGAFSTVIDMPAVWPDGSAVTSDQLVVWARTDDGKIQASAIFSYGGAAPTPVVTNTPAATATPTETPAIQPTATPNPYARVSPGGGSGGTQVIVTGGGFPANVTVSAMLALFDKSGGSGDAERYATTTTNANGDYSMSFTMPSTLPNGEAAPSGPAMIVVATDDLGVSASVTFDYAGVSAAVEKPTMTPIPTRTPLPTEPAPPTETSEPIETVEPTEESTDAPTDTPVETSESTATVEAATETPEAVTPETETATPAPPTDTPEPATATPEPPTATPEPPTEPPTVTPESPTDTPVPPTATPEPPTATPEPPTATAVPPTATLEPPTATPEPPTATPEPPTPEPPTATPEPPTATPEPKQEAEDAPANVEGKE